MGTARGPRGCGETGSFGRGFGGGAGVVAARDSPSTCDFTPFGGGRARRLAPCGGSRQAGPGGPGPGRRGARIFSLRVARVAFGDQSPGRRRFRYHRAVPNLRIRQAAELLGVSDDTVRRWINQGTLSVSNDAAGRKVIASEDLAEFSRTNAPAPPPDPLSIGSSARNRFVGLVTKVISDKVMTQVEMQCGPHTVVSLMSTEAASELNLRPGSVAVAVVKATTVIVETARPGTAISSD